MSEDKYTLYCLTGRENKVEMVRPHMDPKHVTVAMMAWLATPGDHNAVLMNETTGIMLMPELVFRPISGPFDKNQVVIE